MSDPKRLLDELGGGELKDLLHAGKSEVPDDTKLLELAAKMGIAGALGGLGGAGAAGAGGAGGAGAGAGAGAGGAGAAKIGASAAVATKGALAVKVGVAVAVVSLAGAGTVAVTSKKASVEESTPSGIVATATTSAAPMGAASVTLPPRIDPLSIPSAEPSTKTTTTAKPKAEDEVKMLERAQDALKSRPEEALALCNEHAKSYPNGMLAQEREVIAVEALMKTGRTAEAKARAEKFKARFPGSSHARRIDAIVGQ